MLVDVRGIAELHLKRRAFGSGILGTISNGEGGNGGKEEKEKECKGRGENVQCRHLFQTLGTYYMFEVGT